MLKDLKEKAMKHNQKYSLIVNGRIEREGSWMFCVGHYWVRFSKLLNAITYIHIQGSPEFYYLNPNTRRFEGPLDRQMFSMEYKNVKRSSY